MKNPLKYFSPRERHLRAAAEALYQALRHSRKVGGHMATGVDLPSNEPDAVAIVMKLQEIHPEVTVVKNAKSLTLVFDESLKAATSPDLYSDLKRQGFFGRRK